MSSHIATIPQPVGTAFVRPNLITQTYEGGLGGEPGNEAHGGYTYCGLAALMLADAAHVLHLPRLLHWAVHCQARLAWPARVIFVIW